MQNEAQLAGVLAHEVGHVADRHGMQRYQTAFVLSLLGSKYLESHESREEAVNFFIGLITSGFSRNDELEADLIGAKAMTGANYNPDGIIEVMEILGSVAQKDPTLIDQFFATHPPAFQRIEELRGYIYSKYPPQRHHIFGRDTYRKVIHGLDEGPIPGEISEAQHYFELGLIGLGLWMLLR
jgi:predicted Zn-dependent protease